MGEVSRQLLLRNRSEAGPRAPVQPSWRLLAEQKGAVVKVCCLYAATPEHPVHETTGRLLFAREQAIGISLDQGLPMGLPLRTRFSIKVLAEGTMLLFQSQPPEGEPFGGGLLVLKPPRHVRPVQRRQFPRAPLNVPVRIYTNGLVLGDARSTDISAGGMRLRSKLLLLYGQKVALTFQGPDGVMFSNVAGRIVRVEPDLRLPAYAVQFDPVTTPMEAALSRLVHQMQLRQQQR